MEESEDSVLVHFCSVTNTVRKQLRVVKKIGLMVYPCVCIPPLLYLCVSITETQISRCRSLAHKEEDSHHQSHAVLSLLITFLLT